jgi:hypothetical protein
MDFADLLSDTRIRSGAAATLLSRRRMTVTIHTGVAADAPEVPDPLAGRQRFLSETRPT